MDQNASSEPSPPSAPQTMLCVRSERLGPPDQYSLIRLPVPALASDEVLVRVHATSLGYADVLVAAGAYQVKPEVPFVPGSEGSGTVVAIGAGVDRFAPGDRVAVTRFSGMLADHVVATTAELTPIPAGLTFAEAASYGANYATALHGLKDRAALRSGETVLVLGAAGGVGMAAVQIAARLGARVIAGASTPAKRQFAAQHGAEATLDYSKDGWRENLRALTGNGGVDIVFDPVGGDLFEPAFRSLAWGGRHLVVGFAGGPIPRLPANLALLKGAALVGVDVRQFSLKEPDLAAANRALIAEWCADGLRPPVGTTFDFADFRDAMQAASGGRSLGKVVVRIA